MGEGETESGRARSPRFGEGRAGKILFLPSSLFPLPSISVNDGIKTSKYPNPKHLAKYERNLKRKQQKLARKEKGSKSRDRARTLAATVYERISNVRQDYLHQLSRKLVDDNQVIAVENLHVKGMVRNHKLALAISDLGWGIFVNFWHYKLDREGKVLVEIDRRFPSSKLCSNCHYQVSEIPLDVRRWTCPNCDTHHDRDGNASINITAEGIRMLSVWEGLLLMEGM
ncbi:RNA-guided endonuclease TnpB family protein [Microcoleus sp. F4-D5]|uniref:RNA-guided endonuclease TnpB family protein n=1 Tax=Microcoleus sp. F4-D5 TaxID=2818760 RepID=UPI004040ABEA